MRQPTDFHISPAEGEDRSRCSLRPLTSAASTLTARPGKELIESRQQFAFCSGSSCLSCPMAKCAAASPLRIEEGDAVRTSRGRVFFVRYFEKTVSGLRTGFVSLRNRRGFMLRLPLSEIMLWEKTGARSS